MKIKLTPDKKLYEIQEEFNEVYPYLKLEFFTEKHDALKGSPLSQRISPIATISEVVDRLNKTEFDIRPTRTVAELELELQEVFNLPAQVFRNSKNDWLETTETDNLTLYRQNEMGREASASQTKIERYLLD